MAACLRIVLLGVNRHQSKGLHGPAMLLREGADLMLVEHLVDVLAVDGARDDVILNVETLLGKQRGGLAEEVRFARRAQPVEGAALHANVHSGADRVERGVLTESLAPRANRHL